MEYSPTSFLDFFKILCYKGNHFIFSFHDISFIAETSVKTLKITASIITIFKLTLSNYAAQEFLSLLDIHFKTKLQTSISGLRCKQNRLLFSCFYLVISYRRNLFFPSNFASRKILSGIVRDNA